MDNSIFLTVALQLFGIAGLDLVALIILVIIGLIIILLIKVFLVLIPAVLIAILVWFLTGGNLFWTGVAFLVVAALSLIAKL